VVAPGLGSEVIDGAEVAIRFGRPLDVVIDGTRTRYWVTATSVQAALDQLGLASALDALTERTAQMGDLGVQLDVDLAWENRRSSTRLTAELESAVYRLVQEALTNVLKHAEADSVDVSVSEEDSVVEVTVRDSGRGFEQDEPPPGFGLVGMRERVQLLGGSLSIRSGADGTRVEIGLPG